MELREASRRVLSGWFTGISVLNMKVLYQYTGITVVHQLEI